MLAQLLVASLSAPCSAPDRCGDPSGDGPQAGGSAAREPASASDVARLAELLKRQDELILAHRVDLAQQDFEEGYASNDLHCDSSEQLLGRFDGFLHDHKEVTLESSVVRAERVGDWVVADVRRLFTGIRMIDDESIRDEDVETHVLHDVGGRLLIAATYENEAAKSARIDPVRRVWDARAELCYQVALPEPFVPVPRRGPGAALDELLLLDPADDATLGLMLFDPTVDQPLLDLMTCDLAAPDAKVLLEPRRFERAPAGMSGAFEAEVEYPPSSQPGRCRRTLTERVVYLSPDGRLVFALWLRAPPANFDRIKAKVDLLARSLRLSDVKAGRSFGTALLAANPRWNTLADGRLFRTDAAPVELVIPPGLAATPLFGDHVIRLRLRILDDPRSCLVVRLFPSGVDRYPADKILERSVQRMDAFACAEGRGGDSHRSNGTMDVLGLHGDWRGVEISCGDGTRRNYQIVAVDAGDCHVQVQVLPGSNKVDVQSGALKQVLDGLRLPAPPPDLPRAAAGK